MLLALHLAKLNHIFMTPSKKNARSNVNAQELCTQEKPKKICSRHTSTNHSMTHIVKCIGIYTWTDSTSPSLIFTITNLSDTNEESNLSIICAQSIALYVLASRTSIRKVENNGKQRPSPFICVVWQSHQVRHQ